MSTVLIPDFMADATLWDDGVSAVCVLGPGSHGDLSHASTIKQTRPESSCVPKVRSGSN